MIIMSPDQLKQINEAALSAYPNECCGLLVGTGGTSGTGGDLSPLRLSRVAASPNMTQHRQRDRFEVDPKLRFDLMRELENTDQRIIGLYHSHPDHPAIPSDTDIAMIYEPELIWLITTVSQDKPVETLAYRPKPDASGFIPLKICLQTQSGDNP